MRITVTINLHGQWLASGFYAIWGRTSDGEWMSALELKLLLFATHRESFFGTQIPILDSEDVEGIKLSAVDALSFFSSPVASSYVHIEWNPPLTKAREIAPAIKEALRDGTISPSLEDWKDHRYHWTIQQKTATDSQSLSTLTELLDQDEQIGEWVRHLMMESLDGRPEQREALRRLELLQQTLGQLSPEETPNFPKEQELLRLIGWTSDSSPFHTSLRLQEPIHGSGESNWRLTYVLTDQQSTDIVLECDDSGCPVGNPPEAWLPFLDQAASMLSLWLHLVPDIATSLAPPRLKMELNDQEAWGFLADYSQRIVQWGGSVLLPAWWNKLRSQRPKLKASMRNPEDSVSLFGVDQMMKFDWKLSIGDIDLTEEEFHSITAGQKQLHFVRGEWISLDQTLIEQIRKVVEKSKRRKGIPLRELLQRHLANESGFVDVQIDDEAAPVEWEVEMAGSLLQWMQQLSHTGDVPVIPVPDTFHGSLRGYQAQGLSWLIFLRRFGLGGCLADDMGLGKTIQYIAYLLQVKKEGTSSHVGPSLLICPTSLVGNWEKELRRFAPDLNIYLHYGIDRPRDEEPFIQAVQGCDLVVTTYMTALLDIGSITTIHWNSLCLDEAQNIKNAYTKQATAIRRIQAEHRIAMTGTPVENRLSELWSIYEFMNPGYLGSHTQFQKQFSREVERSTTSDAAAQVRRFIKPFMLRRSKSDPLIVPDLPDKIESKVYVPLTKEQAALYDNVLEQLFRGLDGRSGIDRRGAILSALTKLKQICNHPALFTKETGIAAIASPRSHKTIRLLEMVRELRAEGDRCLIFTQYAEMGFMLQRMLEKEMQEKVLYLHGGSTKVQRDRMVEEFQRGDDSRGNPDDASINNYGTDNDADNGIFVLSLKAGGTGLNLTAANHVFHFDRWWNPAVENQATDRAYRIGQSRHVQVHKFICLGTLEERIDEMIEQKQGLTRQITGNGSEQWVTEMSTDELQDLFALRRSWLEG
jgi:SNF2 family DNA or RNA helicase